MNSQNIRSVLIEERRFPPSPNSWPGAPEIRRRGSPARRSRRGLRAILGAHRRSAAAASGTGLSVLTLDASAAPNYRWFTDGELNASYRLPRRASGQRGPSNRALIFVGRAWRGSPRCHIGELHADVCRSPTRCSRRAWRRRSRRHLPANDPGGHRRHAGVRAHRRHAFGGVRRLLGQSLEDRIEDAKARFVITADGAIAVARSIELKATTDKALAQGGSEHPKVIVRTHRPRRADASRAATCGGTTSSPASRPKCEPTWVNAEHPLFLLYTSGSTGKPKGIQHSSAGYLLGAKLPAQVGVRSRRSTTCSGAPPTSAGSLATVTSPTAHSPPARPVVMYEGAPTFPTRRFWKMIANRTVSPFSTRRRPRSAR